MGGSGAVSVSEAQLAELSRAADLLNENIVGLKRLAEYIQVGGVSVVCRIAACHSIPRRITPRHLSSNLNSRHLHFQPPHPTSITRPPSPDPPSPDLRHPTSVTRPPSPHPLSPFDLT